MESLDPVELLRRQYLQLLDPDELSLPSNELLRLPGTQAQMFSKMFNESNFTYSPPERYRFRVLKKLVNALEQSVQDPEEDEISDDISACLAQYMAHPLPSSSAAAQQKSYVTYTAPSFDPDALQITLLEAPSLLASSGTTGFRTWEAALHLGSYLFSIQGRHFVEGKNVLELGAGTGFLSILCSKHLGAKHVLATDGSMEVISDVKANLEINELGKTENLNAAVLHWGHTLIGGVADCRGGKESYDLVIGADVTYDLTSISPLVATMRDLFELYSNINILISATIRNEQTVAAFLKACDTNGFTTELVDVLLPRLGKQSGFFFPTTTPIKVFLITNLENTRDPFAL